MLAIITGTIKPNCAQNQLSLSNYEERFEQYVACIEFYLNSGAFSAIIFCENSGYKIERFRELEKKAKRNNIDLEILSFEGNQQKIEQQGKGYGEGEIMEYVLHNSKLIKEHNFFVKITGRLMIINIKKIIKTIDIKNIYFNIPNKILRNIYDTRFYGMSVNNFQYYFSKKYIEVMDDRGIYLEHVYTDIIKKYKLKIVNFPWYPRIKGVSGSSGVIYDYSEWKCKIKDILCKFNYYTVRG